MQPVIPITNPLFTYVPSYKTDLRKTFERVYKELEQAPKYLYEYDKE